MMNWYSEMEISGFLGIGDVFLSKYYNMRVLWLYRVFVNIWLDFSSL